MQANKRSGPRRVRSPYTLEVSKKLRRYAEMARAAHDKGDVIRRNSLIKLHDDIAAAHLREPT